MIAGGNGIDHSRKGGAERQDHCIEGRQTDYLGIIYPDRTKTPVFFPIGGVCRATEKACQRGGNAIADQRPVKAGVLNKIASHRGRNGRHIPNVLHHGGNCNGGHDQMAVRSNFAITNCCRPTSLEADTAAKSISGVTSPLAFTAVAPQALAIKATRYEPATPSKMGNDLDHALFPKCLRQ